MVLTPPCVKSVSNIDSLHEYDYAENVCPKPTEKDNKMFSFLKLRQQVLKLKLQVLLL